MFGSNNPAQLHSLDPSMPSLSYQVPDFASGAVAGGYRNGDLMGGVESNVQLGSLAHQHNMQGASIGRTGLHSVQQSDSHFMNISHSQAQSQSITPTTVSSRSAEQSNVAGVETHQEQDSSFGCMGCQHSESEGCSCCGHTIYKGDFSFDNCCCSCGLNLCGGDCSCRTDSCCDSISDCCSGCFDNVKSCVACLNPATICHALKSAIECCGDLCSSFFKFMCNRG